MKKLFFIMIIATCHLFGQIKKETCLDYEIKIIDNKKYWDKILYDDKKNPKLKYKKVEFPDSLSLKFLKTSLIDSTIRKKARCEMKWLLVKLNNSQKKEYGEEPDSKFKIVEWKFYETNDGLKIGFLKVQTQVNEWQIGTIFLNDNGNVFTYSDFSAFEVSWKLYGAKKDGDSYKIYACQEGNPDTPYYGKFILSFDGNKRRIEFEGYEKEGH